MGEASLAVDIYPYERPVYVIPEVEGAFKWHIVRASRFTVLNIQNIQLIAVAQENLDILQYFI